MKKLRIAMIGTGKMGRHHMRSYHGIANAELVAACDILPGRAEERCKETEWDIPCYEDYKEMIEKEQIDAVDICTPNYLHSVVAVYALEHGLHVFSEKPDAVSVEEATRMKEAADKAGKVLMVMRNNRWYAPTRYLKKYIEAGNCGEIYAGRCGWQRRRGIPGKGGWFTTKEQSGGGPLIDLGVHMIDLAIYLMGNPTPVSVSGCTFNKFANATGKADSEHAAFGDAKEGGTFNVEDLAMGFIRFDNGACLQIEFSWASNVERERTYVELRGTKAGFTWQYDDPKLTIYTENEDGQVDLQPDYGVEVNGHQENLRHFVNVVLCGEEPDFKPQQGINMIKILRAIYESAETGKEVRL